MDEGKPISQFAQRFVERKLGQIRNQAYAGSGWQRESENNFVDGVMDVSEKIRRPDLRRYFMNEATKSSEYLRQVRDALAGSIRKIVWNGPWVHTDEGRTIRGAVGQTYDGKYRSAEVSLYEWHVPTGRVAFSGENSEWNDKSYTHKEHAIFAARETVQRSVGLDARSEESFEPHRISSAEKYGCQDAPRHALKPPSRSR
jgi:hypothetical protein